MIRSTGVSGEPVGEHTAMVRMAYRQVQTSQKKKYGWIMAALAVIMLAAAGFALYLRHQAGRQRSIAQDLFYAMKSLDLDIANVQGLVADTNNQRGLDEIRNYQIRRQEIEELRPVPLHAACV